MSHFYFFIKSFALNQNNFFDGIGLNPILQDPLLAIHPPVLYVGYVGFSLVFSLAIAGLITKEVDQQWALIVKPGLFCLGISYGRNSARFILGVLRTGWGGYWFWDPVENASLMPWIAATALIHCVLILQKRCNAILDYHFSHPYIFIEFSWNISCPVWNSKLSSYLR